MYTALASGKTTNRFTDMCKKTSENCKMHDCTDDSAPGVQVSTASLQRIEILFFADVLCSRAHAVLSPVGTTYRFTDKLQGIAGLRMTQDCTISSMLGVHMSPANLQEIELNFS